MEKEVYTLIIATILYIFLSLLSLKFNYNRKIEVILFTIDFSHVIFSMVYTFFLPKWYKSLYLVELVILWAYLINEEKIEKLMHKRDAI
ncbi:MAG: hypothetical protein BWY04_01428 [candidate division CPR1 bacterium ADurb.Bin160]|jgi:hypothetical protein|uniref:Uncharacterized protein n=1 Tax=candidate division CPR1 bacterium ADurb.Bin160 TaxID=1852826 RepID=A0A1V5ZJA6_9BACT|nr:MAG: hypothetical protein BWY04_01428 [candidate division CPR1 bacterium ADurb.Bin160]